MEQLAAWLGDESVLLGSGERAVAAAVLEARRRRPPGGEMNLSDAVLVFLGVGERVKMMGRGHVPGLN